MCYSAWPVRRRRVDWLVAPVNQDANGGGQNEAGEGEEAEQRQRRRATATGGGRGRGRGGRRAGRARAAAARLTEQLHRHRVVRDSRKLPALVASREVNGVAAVVRTNGPELGSAVVVDAGADPEVVAVAGVLVDSERDLVAVEAVGRADEHAVVGVVLRATGTTTGGRAVVGVELELHGRRAAERGELLHRQ